MAALPCPPCGQWGYCDGSVGRCICAPGRNGTNCAQLHFGACRLHEEGEMACMTFRGLQSCACRRECEKRFGGVSRRHAQVCWDWASGAVRPALGAAQHRGWHLGLASASLRWRSRAFLAGQGRPWTLPLLPRLPPAL